MKNILLLILPLMIFNLAFNSSKENIKVNKAKIEPIENINNDFCLISNDVRQN